MIGHVSVFSYRTSDVSQKFPLYEFAVTYVYSLLLQVIHTARQFSLLEAETVVFQLWPMTSFVTQYWQEDNEWHVHGYLQLEWYV